MNLEHAPLSDGFNVSDPQMLWLVCGDVNFTVKKIFEFICMQENVDSADFNQKNCEKVIKGKGAVQRATSAYPYFMVKQPGESPRAIRQRVPLREDKTYTC